MPNWILEAVRRGEKKTLPLPICRRPGGGEWSLTLLVARGAVDGPTLTLVAGVHGDEYEGPLALWRTFAAVVPQQLRGTLVILPVCNPGAYEAGERTSPADRLDLARTFPGSPRGSGTQQIAWRIQHDVISGSDLLCDFHSAGRLYRIEPWAGYAIVGDGARLAKQREAACLLGYPQVWGTALLPGRSLAAANECRVPAIYVEAPGEGRALPEDVARNEHAARQLLRYLGMVDEPVEPFKPDRLIEDDRDGAGYLQIQTVATQGGYFEPAVRLGETVASGQRFGRILDTAGRELESIECGCAGRVVFLRTFPVVQAGESLGTVMELEW